MQRLVQFALFWLLAASLAVAQPTFEIGLNSISHGVIPTEEIEHIYVLNVPAGVTQLTIRVDAFGDDADMAVFFQGEELFYDISIDPFPTFTLNNPRAGRYEIYVMNLLWQPLPYELHVTSGGGQVITPGPGAEPTLTIATRTAPPGQPLEVSFSGAPGNQADWIGLYREDANDHNFLTWQYIHGLHSGSLTFTAPVESGRYNFRLFWNNTYTRLATSDTFEVRAAAQPPTPPTPAGPVPPTASSQSLTVRSDEAAVLRGPSGVVLDIPAGAVPVMEDGSIGQMVFSVAVAEVTPVVEAQFTVVGPTFQLEPSGLQLEQPVRVTLPLAEGVDPNSVFGVTTFNAAENRWVVVPGIVDPVARTVTFTTDHLSPWAPVAWRSEAWNRANGGWLRITNNETRGGGTVYRCRPDDPNCRDGLPSSHRYGVCLIAWELVDPNQRFWSARDGVSRTASAHDGQTIRWWLPNGTYTIEEYYHISQINNDPLYVPRHQMYVRPPQTIRISGGETIDLGTNYPGDYQEGWSSCFGGSGVGSTRRRITAVGTGDVQVTLTWQANVDVDLYVTDPNGDTVFYGNTSVLSGGELDRDNLCGNFEWGRPENIFWPPAGAPSGEYRVKVSYFDYCGAGEAPEVGWSVRVVVGGISSTYSGRLAPFETQEVTTFSVR